MGDTISYSSIFPDEYSTITSVGQGLSSLVVNPVKIFMVIILPPNITDGAKDMHVFYNSVVFLTFGLILSLMNLVLFVLIKRFEFTKYYLALASSEIDSDLKNMRGVCEEVHVGTHGLAFNRKNINSKSVDIQPEISYLSATNSDKMYRSNEEVPEETEMSYKEIMKKIYYLGAQIFLTSMITFGLYPGTIVSTYFSFLEGAESRKAWFNITMVTLYAGS